MKLHVDKKTYSNNYKFFVIDVISYLAIDNENPNFSSNSLIIVMRSKAPYLQQI